MLVDLVLVGSFVVFFFSSATFEVFLSLAWAGWRHLCQNDNFIPVVLISLYTVTLSACVCPGTSF